MLCVRFANIFLCLSPSHNARLVYSASNVNVVDEMKLKMKLLGGQSTCCFLNSSSPTEVSTAANTVVLCLNVEKGAGSRCTYFAHC